VTTQATAPPIVSKDDLLRAWDAYSKNAEPYGLTFGALCYQFRMSAEVVQGGTTFRETLAELNIPKSTAYFWMGRYEESIGLRESREEDPEQELISENPEVARERRRLCDQSAQIEAGITALLKKHRITHYRSINLTISYEKQSVSLQIHPSRELKAKNQLFSPHATPRCS